MVDTCEVRYAWNTIERHTPAFLNRILFIYANTISPPVAIANKQTKLTSNAAKTQKAQSKTLKTQT